MPRQIPKEHDARLTVRWRLADAEGIMNEHVQTRTSGLAIASVALSAISFLCLFGPFASIPAVICGHMGRAAIRRSPTPLGGEGLATGGMITGYINIVASLIAIAAFAALMLFKVGIVDGEMSAEQAALCEMNREFLAAVTKVVVAEDRLKPGAAIPMARIEAMLAEALVCPSDGVYAIGAVGEDWSCTVHRDTD